MRKKRWKYFNKYGVPNFNGNTKYLRWMSKSFIRDFSGFFHWIRYDIENIFVLQKESLTFLIICTCVVKSTMFGKNI